MRESLVFAASSEDVLGGMSRNTVSCTPTQAESRRACSYAEAKEGVE
ncbi:MAG: hypothetical protein FWD80_00375 [Propionibacteriaceae bacterium]|nr:hypothetical protein [Propionibacteriaceae bacterium]